MGACINCFVAALLGPGSPQIDRSWIIGPRDPRAHAPHGPTGSARIGNFWGCGNLDEDENMMSGVGGFVAVGRE